MVNYSEMKQLSCLNMVTIVLVAVLSIAVTDTNGESDMVNDSGFDHYSVTIGNHKSGHGNSNYVGDHGNGSHKHHGIHVASFQFEYVRQPLIVSLFMIAVVLCKLGFHQADFLSSWMPESCVLIILGTIVGGILQASIGRIPDERQFVNDINRYFLMNDATNVNTSDFYYIHPHTFFLFLLPPCILEAAYGLHDPVFFENLGTIILYAVVGTIINCFIIAPVLYGLCIAGMMGSVQITLIECFVFSALIVAVDPVAVLAIFQEIGVNSVLYFLVFGESLLNDAVTVVLYNTINTLSTMKDGIPASEIVLAFAAFFTVSLGGLSIGIVFGIFSALITRITQHVRAVEPLAIFSLAYGAYLTAELFHFSGIISMIGCGLMQVRYAFHNISYNSTITVKYFSKMLSGACDSIIFMFLGVALVRDDHEWRTGFVLWSAFLCLIIRFMVTYFLTFIANRTNRERKIETQEQFIMAYGGLRGAVAFCLVAMLNPTYITHKNLFQTTTLFIILFTVFVQGITIKPLVKLLRIQGDNKVISLYQEINDHVLDHMLVFMEEVIGHYGQNTFKTVKREVTGALTLVHPMTLELCTVYHVNEDLLVKINDQYFKHWLQRDPLTKDEVIMELYQEIALQQHFETLYGLDLSSSRLDLYQPSLTDKPLGIDVPLHPDIVQGSLDHYAQGIFALRRPSSRLNRRLTLQYPSGGGEEGGEDEEEQNPNVYDTVRSLPAVMIRGSLANHQDVDRFQSFSEENRKTGGGGKRNLRSHLRRTDENGAFIPNPTSKDVRRWMIKSPNKDAFCRRTDRNLKNADDSELLHLLHEKQLRHHRLICAQSVFSPSNTPYRQLSPAGSLPELPEQNGRSSEGKSSSQPHLLQGASVENRLGPTEQAPHTALEAEVSPAVREAKRVRKRHKTVDFEGSQGHVKYTPRYVPRRVGGYHIARHASVSDASTISAAAAAAPSSRHRLSSIDETHSATFVDEIAKDSGRGENVVATENSNDVNKLGNEETVASLAGGEEVQMESKCLLQEDQGFMTSDQDRNDR